MAARATAKAVNELEALKKQLAAQGQELLHREALNKEQAARIEKLTFEIDYLSRWVPQGVDDDTVREVIRVAVMETRVSDPKQAGQLIGHIMKNGPKGLDGAQVSRLVREALGE